MTGWCRLAASRCRPAAPAAALRRRVAHAHRDRVAERDEGGHAGLRSVVTAGCCAPVPGSISPHRACLSSRARRPNASWMARKACTAAGQPKRSARARAAARRAASGRGSTVMHPGGQVLAGHTGPGLAHHLGQRGLRADHHRRAAGQRLEPGQPEGLRRARGDGHVGAGQQCGQVRAVRQEAGERDRQAPRALRGAPGGRAAGRRRPPRAGRAGRWRAGWPACSASAAASSPGTAARSAPAASRPAPRRRPGPARPARRRWPGRRRAGRAPGWPRRSGRIRRPPRRSCRSPAGSRGPCAG